VPLLYVPGNHDPDVRDPDRIRIGPPPGGPEGCLNVDGRIVEAEGLRVAGLGGCIRYRPGPNQYTEAEMSRRALRLALRARVARKAVDILLTHSPPRGHGDAEDPAHRGFAALSRLIDRLQPKLLVHGHVRRYGPRVPDLRVGNTVIVNAIPYRLLQV
jgi:Icc-related predicted phosphoesterase